jgi:hypothetical protein
VRILDKFRGHKIVNSTTISNNIQHKMGFLKSRISCTGKITFIRNSTLDNGINNAKEIYQSETAKQFSE